MQSTKKFSLLFIVGLLLYGLSFIATKKYPDSDPCLIAIENKISTDTSIGNHVSWLQSYSDTLLLYGDTTRPGNWDRITDTICKVYKTNCVNTVPILIVNYRDTARSTWDTRYGKKIFFKVCP